jgi:hypothetical protein
MSGLLVLVWVGVTESSFASDFTGVSVYPAFTVVVGDTVLVTTTTGGLDAPPADASQPYASTPKTDMAPIRTAMDQGSEYHFGAEASSTVFGSLSFTPFI